MSPIHSSPLYCSTCGSVLFDSAALHGPTFPRPCGQCGTVAYKNPVVLVTAIVEAGGRVLMCQRSRAPRVGFWTLPGGYVEHGESLEQAAVRETKEETGIVISIEAMRLYAISSLISMNQVYVGFVTKLHTQLQPVCGDECLDVRYFSEDEMPWDDLAYPSFDRYLRTFFREAKSRNEHIHFYGYVGGEMIYHDDSALSGTTRTLLQREERSDPVA